MAAWKADEPLSNRGRPQKGQGRKGDNVTISNRGNDTDYTLRRLARDWTQQRIADEVGVDKAYVSRVFSKLSESDKKLNMPSHVTNRNDRADFRKLPVELQKEIRLAATLAARPVAEHGNGTGDKNSRKKNRVDNVKSVPGGNSAEYRLSFDSYFKVTS